MKGKRTNRSIIILLQSMLGMEVRIELKTEFIVEGIVEEVGQGTMDLRLSNVKSTSPQGVTMHLDELFVMGKMILYVHLPDRLNISTHLKEYVQMVDKNRSMYQRSKRSGTSNT
ncbi:lsm10, U7 small nuclear RNA associated [Aphanomyces cochlioides]|nr:lsm10, U7 small nuclear RNA associated [Aphanomyces cochlioides]